MKLGSIKDIAAALNVTPMTAHRYSKRADFPQPVQTLATGRIWDLEQVKQWRAAADIKPGRPKGKPPAEAGGQT